MRTEQVNGRWLLCGCILPHEKIKAGQVWAQADGTNRTVQVVAATQDLVSYKWGSDRASAGDNVKDPFAFQTRYCLVLPTATIPEDLLRPGP